MGLLMLDVANKSQEAGLSLEDAFPEDTAKVTSSELTAFLEQAGLDKAAETAEELVSSLLVSYRGWLCLQSAGKTA